VLSEGNFGAWLVGVRHILSHHALSVEKGAIGSDRGAHDFGVCLGMCVVHRKNRLFEFVVQGWDFNVVAFGIFLEANGPSRDPFKMPFDPPAIAVRRSHSSLRS
jgi:hypothetical protein